MTKTVSLPDMIYADLVSVSGDLTSAARKPFSLGMTVAFLTSFFRGLSKSVPGFEKDLQKRLRTMDILSPEEFDEMWDELSRRILREKQKE